MTEAEFRSRVILVRERMETKEQEILGMWMTKDRMKKSGDYTPHLANKHQLSMTENEDYIAALSFRVFDSQMHDAASSF